ncbi:MAG: hypothetical protein WA797_13420 [Acidimicrobiales bacterium]
MSLEMAIWRMTDSGPVPLATKSLDLESRLEDMVVADPALTGMDLLVVGRQVRTDFGGNLDVLAIDEEAHLHVLELKRGRTPRDVVAQALDYGSWVQSLTLEQVSAIFAEQQDGSFDDAFADRFGVPVPDLFNSDQQLTIVASELDAASDRIVSYLAEQYNVPINAVFFRHFADGEAEYLARTWLIPPEEAETRQSRPRSTAKVRPWNGRDFYVVLGNVERGAHRWTTGRAYGFVGAGGGAWYTKPLRNLTPGKRVFAYVGGAGYVGVGEVVGEMIPLRDLVVTSNGTEVRVVEQPEIDPEVRDRAASEDEDVTEYAVPVRWLAERDVPDAIAERGLFASQVTVCKLRDERTIEVVTAVLDLDGDDASS